MKCGTDWDWRRRRAKAKVKFKWHIHMWGAVAILILVVPAVSSKSISSQVKATNSFNDTVKYFANEIPEIKSNETGYTTDRSTIAQVFQQLAMKPMHRKPRRRKPSEPYEGSVFGGGGVGSDQNSVHVDGPSSVWKSPNSSSLPDAAKVETNKLEEEVSAVWAPGRRNYNQSLHDSGVTSSSTYDDSISPKTLAVLVVVVCGVAIGLSLNFVNLHTDFQDLHDFYRGYQGRRMLIKEGKLTSREYLEAIRKLQMENSDIGPPSSSTSSSPSHVSKSSTLLPSGGKKKRGKNGHLGNGHAKSLAVSLTDIQEERWEENPHCHSNFDAFKAIAPFADAEPIGQPEHIEWLEYHLPLYATNYIEDHDPEWKDLDYSMDIGAPPVEFLEFIRQYEWRIYCYDRNHLFGEERRLREDLLAQFRKWKKRRRKIFSIVVTERAKKEMADQDTAIGSRR